MSWSGVAALWQGRVPACLSLAGAKALASPTASKNWFSADRQARMLASNRSLPKKIRKLMKTRRSTGGVLKSEKPKPVSREPGEAIRTEKNAVVAVEEKAVAEREAELAKFNAEFPSLAAINEISALRPVLDENYNAMTTFKERFDMQLAEAEELSNHIIRGGTISEYRSTAELAELDRAKAMAEADDEDFGEQVEDEVAERSTEDLIKLHNLHELGIGKAGPPPYVNGYYHFPDTKNIDWRYWRRAGPRLDLVHCPGCGAKFQNEDNLQIGYVDQPLGSMPKFEKQLKDPLHCQRCKSILNHGRCDEYLTPFGGKEQETAAVAELKMNYSVEALARLKTERAVVLYIVDVTDFSGSLLDLNELIGTHNPVILGLSKCDLLPKGFSSKRIIEWTRKELAGHGLNKIFDVHVLNNEKGFGTKEMIDQAYGLAKKGDCDVFVIGSTNAGKSCFINSLLWWGWGRSKLPKPRWRNMLTEGLVPHTTLSPVPVATGDGLTLWEMPGVVLPDNINSILDLEEIRHATPRKRLITCGLRFEAGKSLLFGALGRIDFLEGPAVLANWFCSNGVKVHYRKTEGVEDYIYEKAGTQFLYPPTDFDEDFDKRWEWDEDEVLIRGDTWREAVCDVGIAGLGWMSFTVDGEIKIRVVRPKNIRIYKRPPLLPYEAVYGVARYSGTRWHNNYKARYSSVEKRIQHNRLQHGHRDQEGPFPDFEQTRLRKWRGFIQ